MNNTNFKVGDVIEFKYDSNSHGICNRVVQVENITYGHAVSGNCLFIKHGDGKIEEINEYRNYSLHKMVDVVVVFTVEDDVVLASEFAAEHGLEELSPGQLLSVYQWKTSKKTGMFVDVLKTSSAYNGKLLFNKGVNKPKNQVKTVVSYDNKNGCLLVKFVNTNTNKQVGLEFPSDSSLKVNGTTTFQFNTLVDSLKELL